MIVWSLLCSLVKVPQSTGTVDRELVTVKMSVRHWVASETPRPTGVVTLAATLIVLVLGPVMTKFIKSRRS